MYMYVYVVFTFANKYIIVVVPGLSVQHSVPFWSLACISLLVNHVLIGYDNYD